MPDDQTDPIAAFDLSNFLPYRLNVAATRVSRAFAEHYRERFGISIAEWRVLAHLHQSGAVSVRDIEARTEMEKSKISRAASRLEEAGHVAKAVNDADRRLLELTLTPSGQALVAQLLPVAMQFQAEMKAQLGPHAEALDRALKRLLEVSGKDAAR